MLTIPSTLYGRYKFDSYQELSKRVGSIIDNSGVLGIEELMMKRQFLPAGNTLLAGKEPIRPNCSILGMLTDANYAENLTRATRLWAAFIGIGFRFDGMANPAAALRDLSQHHAGIHLGFRPQRGNMGVIDIEHPACRDFIAAKDATVYNFNISVAVSNAFMHRVTTGDRTAVRLLRACAAAAHSGGDPGVVFIDRIQNATPTPFGRIETLVPCGEQGMFPDETCNLGAINLVECDFSKIGEFESIVNRSLRALDNVVDLLDIPDERMRTRTRQLRRIGLGVMGFAALLDKHGIAYASDRAFAMAEAIGSRFKAAALTATQEMAIERGPLWFDASRRNITTTCIAPTGGITLLTGHRSFAIEPFFDEAVTLSAGVHLRMQALWQKFVENSMSKTVNMPESSTVDDVLRVFIEAYLRECKSVTIYRDNSRNGQPISCGIAGGSC